MVIQNIAYYFPAIENQVLRSCFQNEQQFKAHQTYVGSSVLYQAPSDVTASDLAFEAAKKLLKQDEVQEIDYLIFCSLTLDYHAPSTASILHKKLGLKASCGVMDLPLGCAGYTTALMIANGLFKSVDLKRVLVLLGEIPSRAVHPDDDTIKHVFGDAGAAVLLEKSTDDLCFEFGNDGDGFSSLNVLRGGARLPMDIPFLQSNLEFPWLNQFGVLAMDGHGILKLTLSHIPTAIDSLLEKYALSLEQIDHVIFHQASNIVIDALQRKLNLPKEKVINYLAEGGNTISCGIPIAWAKAQEDKRFAAGDRVLVFGFGVGFSWCGTILRVH